VLWESGWGAAAGMGSSFTTGGHHAVPDSAHPFLSCPASLASPIPFSHGHLCLSPVHWLLNFFRKKSLNQMKQSQ
jgi:hypothetical protein